MDDKKPPLGAALRHVEEKPPLGAALRHLAEKQRQSLTSHPPPQELAAYHAGELPPEAESRLLDHLAICRDCSDLLLDLAGFADLKPPHGVPELTDEQVEQDWQALRSRMREGDGEGRKERSAEVVPIRPAGPVPRPGRSYWLPIAASLLAVLGFSFGIYQSVMLGRVSTQLEKLRQPSVEESFEPQNNVRSESDPDEPQKMSSQNGGVVVLYSPDTTPISKLEIRKGSTVLWSTTTPRKGTIHLSIPEEFLTPGSYTVELYGEEGKLDDANLEVE